LPSLAKPAVGYAIGCRGIRAGAKPPVKVYSGNDDAGWFAAITWPGAIGGFTAAIAAPYPTRRLAALGLRAHLREGRTRHA
jgi:hypothetical protein